MTTWTSDELNRIGNAEELEIAPLRPDGAPRKPVTIWVVQAGDELYVRSYRGPGGAWFRAAWASRRGRVSAAGVERDVTFEEVADSGINDRIDAAYRDKYGRYPQYLPPMLTAEVRSTTLRLVPCD